MPYSSRRACFLYAIELVDDVITRQGRKLVIQHDRAHGEARQEDVQVVSSTRECTKQYKQFQRIHKNNNLSFEHMQTKKGVKKKRLLRIIHFDVKLVQI